jgi:hypothetical protein
MGIGGTPHTGRVLRPVAQTTYEENLTALEEQADGILNRSRLQAMRETEYVIRYDPPRVYVNETGVNRPGAKYFYATTVQPRTVYLNKGKRMFSRT